MYFHVRFGFRFSTLVRVWPHIFGHMGEGVYTGLGTKREKGLLYPWKELICLRPRFWLCASLYQFNSNSPPPLYHTMASPLHNMILAICSAVFQDFFPSLFVCCVLLFVHYNYASFITHACSALQVGINYSIFWISHWWLMPLLPTDSIIACPIISLVSAIF